ncbi:glycoside hydrolase family 31 protein [Butyrivibrio sp. MC2013]|uniref:glycoside hydrolase family 31 protein n=1 Tax=Butyrivibrio sp. MC2013 TaxID=1280686 RepID=UPI00041C0A5E|nr:glycoside hydrolase family 31 protein [Butyrivibrio sp. MC2013]
MKLSKDVLNKEYKANPQADPSSMVRSDNYRFTMLTSRLIRMEYSPSGLFLDSPSQVVINRRFDPVSFDVREENGRIVISTQDLIINYDKKAFSSEGLVVRLRNGCSISDAGWHFGDKIRDLGGTARTLDGADGEIEIGPGILSRDGFTILDDSRSAYIGDDSWIHPREEEDSHDIYFFGYGRDYEGCLKDYFELTGYPALLPRYALGNWWSRFYRYSEDSYNKLLDDFAREDIPFSVAVMDMDWHIVDTPEGYGTGWTGFSWNKELFPDPQSFVKSLHERGMKVTLNLHPADGIRAFEDCYEDVCKELGADPKEKKTFDFVVTDKNFMDAYFKGAIAPLEKEGVDFWWLDWQQGSHSGIEGVDALWMLNHLHFMDMASSEKRPMIFSRFAGPGSHRYPIGFSGDSVCSWKSLEFQPRFTATASNIGYSWWSHDIGGHMGGKRDNELTVRWVQFGVFSPIMRLHSTSNEFYSKEPWTFPVMERTILDDFLRLRHRLIPYIYTMNVLTHKAGIPLIRPIYYENDCFPAYEFPGEYLFGSEMLVAPITSQMDPETLTAAVETWIPDGTYYDYFTGQIIRGGKRLMRRSLGTIPVLVKAGGIIPMASDISCNEPEAIPAELDLEIFAGAEGEFTLIEDKGQKDPSGAFMTTDIRYTPQNVDAVITIGSSSSIRRRYNIRLRGAGEPNKVILSSASGEKELVFEYDNEACCILATVDYDGEGEIAILIKGTGADIKQPSVAKRLYDALMAAQVDYNLKAAIYNRYQANLKDGKLDLGCFLQDVVSLRPGSELLEMVTDICS